MKAYSNTLLRTKKILQGGDWERQVSLLVPTYLFGILGCGFYNRRKKTSAPVSWCKWQGQNLMAASELAVSSQVRCGVVVEPGRLKVMFHNASGTNNTVMANTEAEHAALSYVHGSAVGRTQWA